MYTADLIWFPVQLGVKSNKKAEECAVRRWPLNEDMSCKEVLTPLLVAASGIEDLALDEIAAWWAAFDTCIEDAFAS